jgi:hypothetical protein
MKNKLFITTLCVFATILQTTSVFATSVFAKKANCSLTPKDSACMLETYKKMVSQKSKTQRTDVRPPDEIIIFSANYLPVVQQALIDEEKKSVSRLQQIMLFQTKTLLYTEKEYAQSLEMYLKEYPNADLTQNTLDNPPANPNQYLSRLLKARKNLKQHFVRFKEISAKTQEILEMEDTSRGYLTSDLITQDF